MVGTSGKLRGVEAGRGIAALLVVFAHAGSLLGGPRDFGMSPLGGAVHFGYAGVDFFFVLSGFIIGHVHGADVGQPWRFGRYAWRRLVRIYPLYWAVLLVFLALLVVSPSREGWERDPLSLLTSLTLLPHPAHGPILGVAWTLQHELLFYMLFSLVILHRMLGFAVMTAWLALIGFALIYGGTLPYPLGFIASSYNAEFFLGLLVAWRLRSGPPVRPLAWLAAGTTLFVATGMIDNWGGIPVQSVPLRPAYAVGATMALYGLAGAELVKGLVVPQALVVLGSASYALYLTHVIVLLFLQQAFRPIRHVVPVDVAFVFAVLVTVASGVAISYLVEQPLLRRCRAVALRPRVTVE